VVAAIAVGGVFGYCALNDDVPTWCNTLVDVASAVLIASVDDDDDDYDRFNRPNQFGNGFNQFNYENFEFDV
jgi:hypothetical protein